MEHRDCIVEKGCGNRVLQPGLLAGETMQRSEKSEMEHLQCMK